VAEARGDWAAAQEHLDAWLKIDPDNAVAMQRMARALFQQKNPAKALEFLRKAKEANDDVLTPEAQLARFYHEFGDQKNAQIWMDQALKKAPKDVRTHLVAAQWFLESGQLDKAAQEAATAMKLDPKSLEAQIFRGVVALFQKDYKSAETYFQQAHVQSPSNFAASNNLALALAEQDDSLKQRRALEYAQANVRQHQRSAEALSTYGWVLYKLGQVDEAERALRAAAGAGRLAPDTAYYMAVVANAKGRKDEAVQLLQAATKADGPFANRNEAQELLKQLQS
jgi:tetratricopeptide (TPR) repeat protein